MLELRHDRLAPGATAVRILEMKIAEEFSGDDGALPPGAVPGKIVTDDLFGMTIVIHVIKFDAAQEHEQHPGSL
jgi:hypothetical protein